MEHKKRRKFLVLFMMLCVIVTTMGSISLPIFATEDIPYDDPGFNPDQGQEEEPDPFDYDLACYTPDIDFGTLPGKIIGSQKSFTIVNTGNNAFPLTWDKLDPNDAFSITSTSGTDLNPGESASFTVTPTFDLPDGY